LEKVAAEPPEGFGIKTHLTTLRRFHLRARAHFHAEVAADPELVVGKARLSQHSEELSIHALRQAAVELSTAHQRSPAQFRALAHWVTRLKEIEQRERELELANKRIELESRKFEYNAARATLIHLTELKEILRNETTDDEDEVWAAREKIFGPRSNLIEPKP
jgi:tRNA/tmRNA/rRNA uracil-C5-methylase (TrmA/RlmC/RlmD family)